MKIFRFCAIVAITLFFASCRPNGSVLDHDIVEGTPTKADTVLPHKYHLNSDSIREGGDEENVPNLLKR